VFVDVDSKAQQGCGMMLALTRLKDKWSLSRHTSVLDFLKTSSGTCALPVVLFYIGDVIHADDPTEEEALHNLSFVFQMLYFCLISVCTYMAFFGQNRLSVTTLPFLKIFFIENLSPRTTSVSEQIMTYLPVLAVPNTRFHSIFF
jgi:hypothetical protein